MPKFKFMIERFEKQNVLRFSKKFPAVAILGPRQCGKTTLAKMIVQDLNTSAVYLDLEKGSDRAKLEQPETFFEDNQDKTIVLDEIQLMPALFSHLRSAIDSHRKPFRFLLLGSASPDLIRGSSESLAGRIAFVELQPFNLLEIKNNNIKDHFFYGGFPEVALEADKSSALDWLEQFIQTYIMRDLPSYGLPATPTQTRRLVEMLAWNNGNLLNYSNIAKSLGVSHNTIKHYLEFLRGSYMVYELEPFHFNIKKRLSKSSKLYFTDTGMLHRLLRIENYSALLGTPFLGNAWEAYVINQIKALKPERLYLYFYRTYSGAEIDLVLTKGLQPIASVEIKFSDEPSLTRGNTTSIQDLGTEQNFIVVQGEQDYRKRENLTVCGVKEFLINYLPYL